MTTRKNDRVHQILHQTFSVLDEAIAEQRLRAAGRDDAQRKRRSSSTGKGQEEVGRELQRPMATEEKQ